MTVKRENKVKKQKRNYNQRVILKDEKTQRGMEGTIKYPD